MRASRLFKIVLMAFVATSGLAACGGDMEDLDEYINGIKAKPGGRIEPLPEITPYTVFMYVADAEGVRSPFMPDTPQASSATGGTRPDRDRSREYLEGFPLDTERWIWKAHRTVSCRPLTV